MQYIKLILVAIALSYYAAGCGKQTQVTGNCYTTQDPTGVSITCPGTPTVFVANGTDGAVGATGATGAQGEVGQTGATGQDCTATQEKNGTTINCGNVTTFVSDGTDATPVTTVQFCPNPTVYPSTFSEIGICLGGNLYAVYSANGGFLTYLAPGEYSSDGIGSSCNFSVAANCVVTDN